MVGGNDAGSVRRITNKKAYKYLEMEVAGAEAVERAGISFEVERSWFESVNARPSDVILNRLVDGEWTELPTVFEGEDGGSYRFSAESGGFSFFVITAAITADIATPIRIELQETGASGQQEGDVVGDLLGTTQPENVATVTFSWLAVVVIILGVIIAVKYKAIRQALFKGDLKAERTKFLEGEIDKFNKMKQETTKKYYKRVIPEDEFKSLVKEYDDNIIRLEAELGQLKGKK